MGTGLARFWFVPHMAARRTSKIVHARERAIERQELRVRRLAVRTLPLNHGIFVGY